MGKLFFASDQYCAQWQLLMQSYGNDFCFANLFCIFLKKTQNSRA